LKTTGSRKVAKECKTVNDVHNMLKELFKGTLQEILEAEIEEHLGYENTALQVITPGIVAMVIVLKP